MFDGKSFGEELVTVVRSHIDAVITPIYRRLDLIERLSSKGDKGERGEKGERGNDAAPISEAQISKAVTDYIAHHPLPKGDVGKAGDPGRPGENGRDADPAIIAKMVADAVAGLPKPKDGENGLNGKDADPVLVAKMVADAVAAIPKPKDGTDGADGTSVMVDEIAPVIAREVAAAVSKIPPPKDGIGLSGAFINRSNELIITLSDGSTRELGVVVGKDGEDADMDIIHASIKQAVNDAVAVIPRPQDGKSVSLEDVRPTIVEAVSQWLSENPPKDGKDADPVIIERLISDAVSKLPKAKDGKDADHEFIAEQIKKSLDEAAPLFISAAFSKLPKPENGKDAPAVTKEQIAIAVKEFIAGNPLPKGERGEPGQNGKDIDPAMIMKMVDDAVSKLPKAQDGKDAPPIDIGDIDAAVHAQMDSAVARYLMANPIRNGEDGKSIKGEEGRGIKSTFIDVDGNLIITFTDGDTKVVGPVKGADGTKGENGKDIDLTAIEQIIEARIAEAIKSNEAPEPFDFSIPDDMADEVAKAAAILAESPTLSQRAGSRVTRTIRTRRDENGYLVGDVIERGA